MSSKKEFYDKKIDFVINQLSFVSKYLKKQTLIENVKKQLLELKEFNNFLHRVIDQKEQEIKRYEGYRKKYYDLLHKKTAGYVKAGEVDDYGRDLNKRFYFPFK